MPIQTGDVVLLKSVVMADVPEGGGGPSANVVADGKSNDIFPDVSDANRLLGNVALRQVAVAVRTDDTDTLMGLHITATQPQDPAVSVLLFADGGQFTQRAEAANRVEAWLFSGPMWPGFLLERHIKGMRSIQICLHPSNGSVRPAIGQTLWLVQDEGKSTQVAQYVRITKVSVATRTFVDEKGQAYQATVQTLDLSDPLENDFTGTSANPRFVAATGAAVLRDTTVADAARYYGTTRLATAALTGDRHIKARSIYGQLVPGSQVETPLTDMSAAGQGAALVSAGAAAWCEFTTTLPLDARNRLALGGACEPGTLTITSGSGPLTDDGGRLMQAGVACGTVDYAAGIVACTSKSITGSKTVKFRSAVAPVLHYDGAGYAVTVPNRAFNWAHMLPVRPAKGTLSVAYMANGAWYELRDDGSGILRGADAAFGIGRLDADSLTASATLGALPDVGSEVIWFWSTSGDFDATNTASGQTLPLAVAINPGKDIKTDGATITWPDGVDAQNNPIVRTATCNAAGVISGYVTGKYDKANGRMLLNLAKLPPMGTTFTVTPAAPVQWSAPVTGFQASGNGANVSLTLGRAIEPGSAVVHVPLESVTGVVQQSGGGSSMGPFGVGSSSYDYTITPAPYTVRLRDNGAGQLLLDTAPDGGTGTAVGTVVGTVNYETGAFEVNVGALSVPFTCRVVSSQKSSSGGLGGVSGGSTSHAGSTIQTSTARCSNPAGATVQFAEPKAGDPPTPLLLPAAEVVGVLPLVSSNMNLAHASLLFAGALTGTGVTQTAIANGSALVALASGGDRVTIGTVNTLTGELRFEQWASNATPTFTVQAMLRRFSTQPLVYGITWRVPQIPLKPSQLQVRASTPDGAQLTAFDDADGNVVGSGVTGSVSVTTGVARVQFASGVLPETLRYNALAYSYLPVGADVLGLNPVRLPQDGRVPVFRAGDIVVVGDARVTAPMTVSSGQTISLGRERVSRVRVVGDNGLGIHAGYSVDLDAGTVTFDSVSGYSQPVRIQHHVEDAIQAIDVQIDGTIKLGAPLAHDYAQDCTVYSALYIGDRFARVKTVFAQQAWDGNTWSDTLSGNRAVASYNTQLAPIVVTNRGAVTERWALKFASTTEVDVIGEHVGHLGRFPIGTDVMPLNPHEGVPYFKARAVGFGGGWVAGNTLFIHTVAASAAFWTVRTVQKGQGAVLDDTFELTCRYNVDRLGGDQP